MSDFLIPSLRGGQSEDSPLSLPEDSCTECTNVQFVRSMDGERRLGCAEIDLTGSGIEDYDEIVWTFRHYTTPYISSAQFWVLAYKASPATATFVYKDATGWHTVAPVDAIDLSYIYKVVGQTLHGKLFIAFKSAEDRLHVWDGTTLRRTGLAEPAAPSVAETGSGSFSGIRYYRIRYTVQDVSGNTLLRSEPSEVTTYDPADFGSNGLAARVTKPASIGESETHWEVEASLDDSNFYRIATLAVATTTYDDSTDYTTGYATLTDAVLSERIGAYSLIPSVRFLTAVDDRLMTGANFEDDTRASEVGWTPVLNADGVGNDERFDLTTDPLLNLDNYEGGGLTGISVPLSGYVFATKFGHIYQLNKSGVRTAAYEVNVLSKARGCLEGSLVSAVDNTGNPTLFGLDPDVGPIRFSARGLEPCGMDLFRTWETVNLDATTVLCRAVYFHENMQVMFWIATGASDVPDKLLVLHTEEMREAPDGTRRGWVVWDGPIASALTVTMFHENLDDIDVPETPSSRYIPFIGVAGDGLIWKTNTGSDDNGTAYHAKITSRPFVKGNLMNKFGIMSGAIFAAGVTDATVKVTITGIRQDGSEVEKEVDDVDFTPLAGEGDNVIRHLDNLSRADLNAVSITVEDTVPAGSGQWSLGLMALRQEPGQKS